MAKVSKKGEESTSNQSDFYACPSCGHVTYSVVAMSDVRCARLCGFKGELMRLAVITVQTELNLHRGVVRMV